MTGPVDCAQLEADLLAAGVHQTMASALASEFDPCKHIAVYRDPDAAVATSGGLLTLARAGLPGGTLWRICQAGVVSDAATLHERGVPVDTIDRLASAGVLPDAAGAVDAGASTAWLDHVGTGGTVTAWQLTELTTAGMTDARFDLISRTGGEWVRVRSILEKGGTWDEVTTLLTAPSPSPSLALGHYYSLLADTPPTPVAIPRRVQVLACTLASSMHGPSPRELMPLASAIIDQPWQATALTLIADQPAGPPVPASQIAILTARALENDPALPAPTAPIPGWASPPVLAAASALPDGTPHEVLTAAGVDPDTAAATLTWLGPRADALTRTPVDLDLQAWNITCLDTIAIALARGTTLTDLRLATSITVSHASSLGVECASLVLACGISLATAEQWAAAQYHVTTTAMLTAYGVDQATLEAIRALDADRPLEADRAWQAVSLLAGGIPADRLLALLPVFEDAPSASMWSHLDARAHMPVPAAMLEELAAHGVTLRAANHLWRANQAGTEQRPDAAGAIAIELTAQMVTASSDQPLPVAVLGYAAAAAGQPWAAHVTIDPADPDPWLALAARVADARGARTTARTITRAARSAAPALTP